MCNLITCGSCGSDSPHRGCRHIMLATVTGLLEERTRLHGQFIKNLVEIEDAAIRQLVSSRGELTRSHYLGNLGEDHLRVVEEIFQKRNPRCLVGSAAKAFFEGLQEQVL